VIKMTMFESRTAAITVAKESISNLRQLIEQSEKALKDASAPPVLYQTVSQSANEVVSTADAQIEALRNLHNTQSQDEDIQATLADIETLKAHAVLLQKKLNDHWCTWQTFLAERDSAANQLDNLRQPLNTVLTKELRPLNEVEQDVETLKANLYLLSFKQIG
jgi:DNA repair exonuclease SbcCD ATPase subunit